MKKYTVLALSVAVLTLTPAFAEKSKTMDPGKPIDPAQVGTPSVQSETKASGIFSSGAATGSSLKEQSQAQIQTEQKTEQEQALNNSSQAK